MALESLVELDPQKRRLDQGPQVSTMDQTMPTDREFEPEKTNEPFVCLDCFIPYQCWYAAIALPGR